MILNFQPELIMRREISLKGANRCFLNDTPVTLSLIKDVGNLLVDLHGQHEHQTLLRTETHIEFLDEFGNLDKELISYKKYYHELTASINELKSLKEKETSLKEKKDLYAFQIKEIDAVSPEEDEEEKLAEELNILENSEKLLELTSDTYSKLYESENSIIDVMGEIKNNLEELVNIDKSFSDSLNESETAIALINDISEFIRNYNSRIDLEPKRLEEIRGRLGAINLLKKKFGGSINSIIQHRKKIGDEYDLAENFSENISLLEKQINIIRIKLR